MTSLACKVGIHKWKPYKELTVCGKNGVEFGGYFFNPSTKKVFVCPDCGRRKEEIYDFKGDRE